MVRVNPSALPDGEGQRDYYTNTPMEIALLWDRPEMLKILEEFTEIPDKVKLLQLSRAMYKEDTEEAKKKFKELLRSLTPELVRFS